ncbi:unnamed protein product [Vitrella brassicaformis CCMP3155]|uniref:Uncharacterized protein n=1 Tax=Vitrella brassicaformis (strain CCMP3155) TaxID=1169540 RepID=A0A0G4ET50_VITBC|nr:unnamed protein product [Vitrella brassicaformis CCMP3155]|mmetsp:Transcript_15146/g.36038  ORF Transcript_15146/g.36038 Transcript_15146/m.36038 type:complete len:203 (-) Transcript_15146:1137-1745(-)|eukprot:CEM01601.1 unnamed protein product [Vitrella brassicaformis CCMP3155]
MEVLRRARVFPVPSTRTPSLVASRLASPPPLSSATQTRSFAIKKLHAFRPNSDEVPRETHAKYERHGNPDSWEKDPRWQAHMGHMSAGARGMNRPDVSLGPHKRGWILVWTPIKDDPWGFFIDCVMIATAIYTVANLSWGEPYHLRRKRVIIERLYKEYGLTEADVDEIEGYDAPLSDDTDPLAVPAPSPAFSQSITSGGLQ